MNCKHCHIGRIHAISTPYVQWLNDRILIIPDATALSCDICGYMEYDANFVYKLNYLLDKFSDQLPIDSLPSRQTITPTTPLRPLTGRR